MFTLPVLVTVTTCGGLEVPGAWGPNVRLPGDASILRTCAGGAAATPGIEYRTLLRAHSRCPHWREGNAQVSMGDVGKVWTRKSWLVWPSCTTRTLSTDDHSLDREIVILMLSPPGGAGVASFMVPVATPPAFTYYGANEKPANESTG